MDGPCWSFEYNTHERMGWRLAIVTLNSIVNDTFDFVFALIGPILPYDVTESAMITTKNNRVVLVGGLSDEKDGILNILLQLEKVTSKWKEIKLPLKKLRNGHIAFKGTSEQMKIFCGKSKEWMDGWQVGKKQFLPALLG